MSRQRLNRTFYGIETRGRMLTGLKSLVLIVPFMELKHQSQIDRLQNFSVLIVPFMELKRYYVEKLCFFHQRLNRTFYGIETLKQRNDFCFVPVLIVPFMELKH